jgi:AraC family transcriptional regulator
MTLHNAVRSGRLVQVGPPRAIYTTWGPSDIRFTVAIPIDHAPQGGTGSQGVTIATLPECTALRFVHRGAYRDLRQTYDRIDEWLRERGGITEPSDWARYAPMWEEYLNDPAQTPESELLTRIYLTLR